MPVQPFVQLFIWISAFTALSGWTLSALGQLNRTGYAVAFVAFAVFLFSQRRNLAVGRVNFSLAGRKLARRARRLLPFCFFALAVLIFIGSVVYRPTHYVALTYHLPRVLHWLAAGRWNWIHTQVVRMNYTGCDFEWLFTPLLLFTKSNRVIFLLNFIPYLLMPGLVFSVFTRLGVRPRVAWQWMWLLPTGYNFLLQAGSIGNDAISAFYALAALDFALRARTFYWVKSVWSNVPSPETAPRSGERAALSCAWQSMIAAALLTGTKPVSLPLLLPLAILLFPLIPLLVRHWLPTLAVGILAIVTSFFPLALMNKLHCGDWMGSSLEVANVQIHNPLLGIAGNGFELLQDNLVPPLFPMAEQWDHAVAQIVPHDKFVDFEEGFFATGELPTEDWAGVGFGVTLLALVSVIANLFIRNRRSASAFRSSSLTLVLIAPWVALLFYCAKAGMATPARLIAPYYPLLLPLLLVGAGQSEIVRRIWWRSLAGVVMLLAFIVLVLSPDRPLWPAQTILSGLAERYPQSRDIVRAREVYAVYSKRADPLADVRAFLPPDIKVVGFIGTADDCELSFWLPFGSRRVEDFLLSDPPEQLRQKGVEYVVVGGLNLNYNGITINDWLQKNNAELLASTNCTLKVTEGPQQWFVTRLKP